MDFFEQQNQAHRNTRRLVLLLIVGVLGIVVSVHAVIALTVSLSAPSLGPEAAAWSFRSVFLDLEIFLWVAIGVVVVVSSGSYFKTRALAGGGEQVARSLGGRRVDPSTDDADERKLLNVVEEMAIASGIPVPPVYVMDREEGINAFAAGYEPTHAVIGVTRGAIAQLDRDELQGVIAHEFSHILNGDMRLNIKLIGLLHGLLLIGIIGRILMRSGGGRRSRDGGNQLALVGVALFAIGYLGTLAGSIIKAAVSRQREYLADSSADQFTRNPRGIAGALAKIGGIGSKLEHPRASELSHMYFGEGVRSAFGGVFATHPPLRTRIERIDPSLLREAGADGREMEASRVSAGAGRAAEAAGAAGFAGGAPGGRPGAGERPARPVGPAPDRPAGSAPPPGTPADVVSLKEALAQLGRPTPTHLAWVRELLGAIPSPARQAANDLDGARALVATLLLAEDAEVRTRQLRLLAELQGAEAVARIEALREPLAGLDPRARLPLLEIAIGTLSDMPEEAYRAFRRTLEKLAHADGSLEPFEWVTVSLVLRHADPDFSARRRRGRYTRLQGVGDSLVCLLSALAHAGHDDPEEAAAAFRTGLRSLEELGATDPVERPRCGPAQLDAALDEIAHLEPRLKRQVLEASARTIAADGLVSVEEGELFRVIADWLDCPVPPLLPGQRVQV